MHHKAIVIGGGISGLHVLYELRMQGIDAILLDENPKVGGAWRYQMKDWQTLQNCKKDFCRYGLCKKHYKKYMTKADVVDYMESIASRIRGRIRLSTRVKSLKKKRGQWLVKTKYGRKNYTCDHIVICNGVYSTKLKQKNVLHSSEVEDISVKRCAVVGGGASALDMVHLAKDCEEVYWIGKNSRWFFPTKIIGITNQPLSLFGFLQLVFPQKFLYKAISQVIKLPYLIPGLKRFKPDRKMDLLSREPVVLKKEVGNVLRKGTVKRIKSNLLKITKTGVLLENGQRIVVDQVIMCTGYGKFKNDFNLDVDNLFCKFVSTQHENLYFISPMVSGSSCVTYVCHTVGRSIGHFVRGKSMLPPLELMNSESNGNLTNHIDWEKCLSRIDPYGYPRGWYLRSLCANMLRGFGFTIES
jgi:hypothetical protein